MSEDIATTAGIAKVRTMALCDYGMTRLMNEDYENFDFVVTIAALWKAKLADIELTDACKMSKSRVGARNLDVSYGKSAK